MECSKNQQLEDIAVNGNNASKAAFPWLPKFNKMIHSSTGSKNYQLLEQSLLFYIQNILASNVGEINVKSDDTVNLKNHISNMLIFFHLYWLDIKQDIADHSSYLNKISALLIIYIDMELKTSNHVKNSSEIAAKLLAALYIYLNSSGEHIFRVLLRIKRATEKYTKVCDYIFTKSFTNFTTRITPMTDITYVRYLLAFKMWEKMKESSERKKKINRLAPMLLGSRMPKLRDELLKFMPKPPTNQENETLWLLQSHVFDLKQVHKRFLLLEDKVDLQYNKLIYTTQTYLKYQKHEINSICYQGDSIGEVNNDERNKDYLTGLQNHKIIPNINENKSMNQVHPIKKEIKIKTSKKKRNKTRKTIIIDLTGDEEANVPYKRKRKKNKRDFEQLRMIKTKHKLQKHTNTLKHSNPPKLTDANIQKIFNQDKSSVNKILSECKLISNNKVSDYIECHNLIDNKPSLDTSTNFQGKQPSNVTKDHMSNLEFGKEDEMQHDDNLHNLKLSRLIDHNIKEFKAMTNVSKENKSENPLSSHMTYVVGNTANSYGNSIMQNKEILTSQEESAMETIPLFKVCQDNIADQYSLKQELPTTMNCSAMQKSHKYCEAVPVDVYDINRLIIQKLKSINDHSSQITEIIKQKVCHQVNECTNCRMKIECKPFVLINNDVTAAKIQNTLHNTFNDSENDVKSACDTNIIYMLSDRNKCVYVVNHVDERVTTVHTEKRMQCLDKPNDMCTVSTTFTGDQIVDSSLHSQHVNFDNIKINAYGAKYPETAIKEQQEKSNCDTLLLNDQIHSSESCIFDINSFEIDPNEEVDYESQFRNFPKIEEANETMKSDYADDLENISFVHNIQNETLEDFLQRPFMTSQINYDNSIDIATKKPLVADNNAIAVKTQDTLPNKFDDIENSVNSGCNTNMVYMLSDRNRCLCVTNHIGECIMTANTGKKIQSLDKSNGTCSVSNNFNPDQVIESALDSQHVNFDHPKADNYEYSFKYSTMKEQQQKNNFITSNDRKHSSESCTFDINPFEIQKNSKEDCEFQLRNFPKTEEVNEPMKIDGVYDLENNHLLYNIQNDNLEDFLRQSSNASQMSYDNSAGMSIRKDLEENVISATVSNDITESLLQKQYSGKLNNVTDILLSQKTILCNNQNDAVDDSVDPVAFRLNADDIFLQLPVQLDKTVFQGAVEFRYSY